MRVGLKVKVTKLDGRANRERALGALDTALFELSQLLWDRIEEVCGTQMLTYEEMRAMGYPYARRDPQYATPSGYINKQSEAFFNAFDLEFTNSGDVARLVIVNKDDKATLLSKGSDKMVGRYYGAAILKGVDAAVVNNLVAQFSRFVKVEVKKVR